MRPLRSVQALVVTTIVGAALVTVAACDDSTTSSPSATPDASVNIDASSSSETGTSDAGAETDGGDGGASGCAAGGSPSTGMRTAAGAVIGGHRLWGYLSAGNETAETNDCEKAKGFYITPVINGAMPLSEADLDANACAMQAGGKLPVGDFGYNEESCGTLPCSGSTFYLVMDPNGERGEITTVLSDGTKQHFSYVWVRGDKILVSDMATAGALYSTAGNAFSCTPPGG